MGALRESQRLVFSSLTLPDAAQAQGRTRIEQPGALSVNGAQRGVISRFSARLVGRAKPQQQLAAGGVDSAVTHARVLALAGAHTDINSVRARGAACNSQQPVHRPAPLVRLSQIILSLR